MSIPSVVQPEGPHRDFRCGIGYNDTLMDPRTTLTAFDQYLADRGLALELAEAITWLEPQDLNPHWPEHVRATLGDLARRLGHGT